MNDEANSPEAYIDQLSEDRAQAIRKLRSTVNENLPEGFEESMTYGMISYGVPHRIYPAGYHCKPEDPLPYISIASQKNFIALYHMGIYTFPEILAWFQAEYPKHVKTKLDMGKSCIRFKKMDNIPYNLIAELCRKITVKDYIDMYETSIKIK